MESSSRKLSQLRRKWQKLQRNVDYLFVLVWSKHNINSDVNRGIKLNNLCNRKLIFFTPNFNKQLPASSNMKLSWVKLSPSWFRGVFDIAKKFVWLNISAWWKCTLKKVTKLLNVMTMCAQLTAQIVISLFTCGEMNN